MAASSIASTVSSSQPRSYGFFINGSRWRVDHNTACRNVHGGDTGALLFGVIKLDTLRARGPATKPYGGRHVKIAKRILDRDIARSAGGSYSIGRSHSLSWPGTANWSAGRSASRIWHCAPRGTAGVACHVWRSGKARTGGIERSRARLGSEQLASQHGAALRAAPRAAQSGPGTGTRTVLALESGAARAKGGPCARPIHPQPCRSGATPCKGRRHCFRSPSATLALVEQ